MTIVTCIEDNIYLNWQAELLSWNCQQHGHQLVILSGYTDKPSAYANRISKKNSNYISIEDTRPCRFYAPSIQPHLLSKYVDNIIDKMLLVDSDVLFRDFKWLKNIPDNTTTVYGSDVSGYINAAYIDGCDPHLLDAMARVVRCPAHIIRDHRHCIGAQYLLPNGMDQTFWQTVEQNSNNLHTLLSVYKCSVHQVQIWTASMWAILWELYKRELSGQIEVYTHKDFDFCWANEPINRYFETNILHCAGVTMKNRAGLFCKSLYTKSVPFGTDLNHILPGTCSRVYADAIVGYKNN